MERTRELPRCRAIVEAASHPRFFESCAPERLIGCTIAGYTITTLIASGGMASVFDAQRDLQPSRVRLRLPGGDRLSRFSGRHGDRPDRVALKILNVRLSTPWALRHFEIEGRLLARLRHPDIVTLFDAGIWSTGADRIPYLTMEYIASARPITEYMAVNRIDRATMLRTFIRVCDAADYGHRRGVIHCDLKPSNIIVTPTGAPRIIDFGIGHALDHASEAQDLDAGRLIGTVQYMSPEQCETDRRRLDARSDVYALGTVLYELLCGSPPLDVGHLGAVDAARVIGRDLPIPPRVLDRTIPVDLETITMKALQKAPHRRPPSAAALAEDLRRVLGSAALPPRP